MKRPATKVLAPVTRRSTNKVTPEAHWYTDKKKCARCEKVKVILSEDRSLPDFGIIVVRGKQYAAGWCRQCRSEEQYYNKPRKYRTVNNPG